MFWAQWTYGIWCNREMAAVRKKHLPIKTACLLVCQTLALLLTCALGASAEVIREDEPQIAKDVKQPVYHWVDKDKPVHGLIVALHGATLHGGAFDPMARKLAEQGYETYAPDLRGFGRWCTDRYKPVAEGEIAFYRSREDIIGLILALREQRPNVPIYMMGESLGANLSLWIGSVHPNLIDGIVIASPCSSRRSGLSPTLAADFAKFWVNMKRNIPLQPYAKRFLSEDDKVTEAYINDPGNRKTMTFWESMQSMHANKSSLMYVEQIPSDMHILCIVGEKDKLYKASAAKELMKRIPSPSARLVVLKDRGHIHFETPYIKDDVMADVTNWLTELTGQKTAENNVHGEGSALGKKL
ncbi:MAG: hypothetical protein C0469_07310 [Cyanobacteria bacterium DS2.3.42]|nr:hypothetical protein [Cyanobacteria bacterium DS2.3.42]